MRLQLSNPNGRFMGFRWGRLIAQKGWIALHKMRAAIIRRMAMSLNGVSESFDWTGGGGDWFPLWFFIWSETMAQVTSAFGIDYENSSAKKAERCVEFFNGKISTASELFSKWAGRHKAGGSEELLKRSLFTNQRDGSNTSRLLTTWHEREFFSSLSPTPPPFGRRICIKTHRHWKRLGNIRTAIDVITIFCNIYRPWWGEKIPNSCTNNRWIFFV